MPRSSRHKSHKQHKHSSRDARERSDSEDEGTSRERRSREEPAESSSRDRVSRDPEPEKRKSSSSLLPSQGKDLSVTGNGDFSTDCGKKRKDRLVDSASVADRWSGGGVDDRLDFKELKGVGCEHPDLEKMAKSKILAGDSKGKSSRRGEGSSVGKDNSAKRRSEKDSGRRESGVQCKYTYDGDREHESEREQGSDRDRDRVSDRERDHGSDRGKERGSDRDRERASEKERVHSSERGKKVQDTRRERSDDPASRKEGSLMGSPEEERIVKRDVKKTDWQIQDELCNPELEKNLEKQIRKRKDSPGDKDKWQEDGRDGADSRLYSKDDRTKSHSYKDEKYRGKYWEDVDREERQREDKHWEDHSLRDRTSDRSDSKHHRDENKPSENCYKKSKHQDSDHDGSPYTEDHDNRYKDNRRRKRSSDGNEAHSDLKSRNAKEPYSDLEKNALTNCNVDLNSESGMPVHSEKVDSTLCNNQSKSSPSSISQSGKDQYRNSSKQSETARRNSLSEERLHHRTASSDDLTSVTIDCERVSEPWPLEKSKQEDLRSDESLVETVNVTSSHYERTPRSGRHGSPIQLEKSPSSASDRQQLSRMVARRSLDVEEMAQRSSSLKDGRNLHSNDDKEEFSVDKPAVDNHSQAELVPAGLPSLNRTDNFSSGPSSHLPPPPPVRFGIDSPSVLGSSDEDSRVQAGDRKPSNRYKRNGDFNVARGQGNAWKGIPNWPSSVANGFIPFQHGPPHAGFHPVVQQFSTPALFNVRPSMDLSHTGVSYHMHETPDRFSTHVRPFGWRNPADETLPPRLQGWDGNNGMFGDESLVFGRHEWEQNRHLINSRGWEMGAEMWKGQNGSLNLEFPAPLKEADYSTRVSADDTWVGQSNNRPCSERSRSERLLAESIEIKRSNGTPSAKNAAGAPPRIMHEKTPEPSKPSNDGGAHFCGSYLCKLDISADLARPDLYKQCIGLIRSGDVMRDSKVTKRVYTQDIREDIEVAMKSSNNLLSFLFPAITDAVFQRAVSLYKKRNEEIGTKIPLSFLQAKEENDSPRNPDVEEVEQVKNLVPEETPQANIEESNLSIDAKGDFPGNAMDTIPSSVFVEGSSEACEALMPECRVNLSRIHHSTESTR